MRFCKIILVLSLFTSCTTTRNVDIDNSFNLTAWTLSDENLMSNIDDYILESETLNETEGIVFVVINRKEINDENLSEYYISSIRNLSSIYRLPISSYFYHNKRPVIVYFKKGPFVNPINYPTYIVKSEFRPWLIDDWFGNYDTKSKDFKANSDIVFSYHPSIWHFRDNALTKDLRDKVDFGELLFKESDFDYTMKEVLDNYRVE